MKLNSNTELEFNIRMLVAKSKKEVFFMEIAIKSRKEQEDDNRRLYILKTAEKLFAQNGFHETSVSDIARESEFGIGTLYKYFKDKDTLFLELLKFRTEQHYSILENILNEEGKSPLTRIYTFVDKYIDYLSENKAFFFLFYTYVHPRISSDHTLQCVLERRMKFIAVLGKVLEEARKQEEIIDVDIDMLLFALYGTMISVFFLALHKYADKWNIEDMKAGLKTVIFNQVASDPIAFANNK